MTLTDLFSGWIITLDTIFFNPVGLEDEPEQLYRFARMCSILNHNFEPKDGPTGVTLWVVGAIRFFMPVGTVTHNMWLRLDPQCYTCFVSRSLRFLDSDPRGSQVDITLRQLYDKLWAPLGLEG